MTLKLDDKLLAVIGLGYVGLSLAVEFGKVRRVIGFYVRKERIDELRAGRDSTLEVEADDLRAAKHLGYFCFARESQAMRNLYRSGAGANRSDMPFLAIASKTDSRHAAR